MLGTELMEWHKVNTKQQEETKFIEAVTFLQAIKLILLVMV